MFGPKKYEMVWYKRLTPIFQYDDNTRNWKPSKTQGWSGQADNKCENCLRYALEGVNVTPEYTRSPYREPWLGIQRYIFIFPPKHGKLRIEKVNKNSLETFLKQNNLSERNFPKPSVDAISGSRTATAIRLGRKADEILLTRQKKSEESKASKRREREEQERSRVIRELRRRGD